MDAADIIEKLVGEGYADDREGVLARLADEGIDEADIELYWELGA